MTITGVSGLETLLQDAELIGVGTPYCLLFLISIGDTAGKSVASFLGYQVQNSHHSQRLDCQCACLILQQVLRAASEHLSQNRKYPCEHVLRDASFEVK